LIGLDSEGDFILLDVVRGQWEPHKRDSIILATAASDGRETLVRAEQEPGASGVAQIDAMTRRLTGYRFKGERFSGDKVVRADAVASQSGIGRGEVAEG
jgi:phage terminase large subunit-like protein